MSVGVAISHKRKMSDGRYVADLAALFERRRIDLGDLHVCEQFEILLRTSDSFRGQLFTLCTAISHMSEEDRTAEELLDLIARALRTESEDGAALPATLRKSFVSGFDAWSNRGLTGEDEWPPAKKPVASVFHAPSTASEKSFVERDSYRPGGEPGAQTASAQTNGPTRPDGVPTLQEALEMARIRGGNRPLRPEAVTADEVIAPVQPAPQVDVNSTAIHELNTLLGEIEERMNRLRPQLVPPEPEPVPPAAMEPAIAKLKAMGLLKPEVLSPGTAVAMREPPMDDRDAEFFARHPYLLNKRPVPVIDTLEREPVQGAALTPVMAKAEGDTELQLIPRNFAEIEPVSERPKPTPPTLVAEESTKLKTYLAIAVLAGIVLVGTPISAVIAYRYMHPLYMYEPAKPAPVTAPQPAEGTAAGKPRSSQGKRKGQATRHKPSVAVWPPEQ